MILVVGLGNPGKRYARTRHNVGFDAVDKLAEAYKARWRRSWRVSGRIAKCSMGEEPVLLLKPMTYMNRSGAAIAPLMKKYGLESDQLVVLVDDMELPCGRIRVRPGGQHGGHNGLKSVEENLQTRKYARVRIGIGRPEAGTPVLDHVLSRFGESESTAVEASLERTVQAVETVVGSSVEQAMNEFNGTY